MTKKELALKAIELLKKEYQLQFIKDVLDD